ncbi:protein of unknown function [Taphrina deformans PYCC 5710]|uniref:GAF domain-containing protein n=1 Tax=Taphrina deformans (strain PYCC 5710 / ATCC 11124 / CBS 356.35 / IMI 108563 / JCM 9778 / NBRC 8474) TaxID=1097556 RepID=R4XDQ6_TAPDE|nr:protein of unknown function [Taphrina deformans PYCC 5710]|eukprot:CCG82555.1 protein of unknown function [Taphrina deformans PYCC 5710]
MQEIRSLYEQNQQEKMTKMNDVLATFPQPANARTGSAHVASALELEEQRLKMRQDFTPEQQQAVFKAGRNQGLKVVAKTGDLNSAASERLAANAHDLATQVLPAPTTLAPQGEHMLGRPIGEGELETVRAVAPQQTLANKLPETSPTTLIQSGPLQPQSATSQNPYDLSVLLIAQTLNLDLVYLLALDQNPNGGITTRVVSSHGLANDPVFDAGLHGRALRSKSGLLYVHPDPDSEIAKEMGTYISGMLVPVLQLSGGGGYVLAAFTKEKSQIFVAEDLKFLRDFGISLMKWLLAADAKELEASGNVLTT